MKPHGWFTRHGACALCGVLCFVFLAGCSSSERLSPGKDARPNPTQERLPKPGDPPPSAKTLYSMADILATQGKESSCEFVLRRCISEYPRFVPAYNSLAELEMRQGRVNEAVADLSKALEIRPRDPVLLNNLGMCFLVRQEYAQALDQFTKAAGVVPENEKYRANMATALGLLGRNEEALALLQQVLPGESARNNAEVLRRAFEKQTTPEKASS